MARQAETGTTGGTRCRIAVSIINYRTADMTLGCVGTVLADLARHPDLAARVVVIDNASGDGSADGIAEWIAATATPVPVSLVRSATNSGFSGGHNQGFAAVRADYYLILNSDAELRPGFFAALRAAIDADPDAGLFAPRLEAPSGEMQNTALRFHNPVSEFIRGINIGRVTRRLAHRDLFLGPDPDPDQVEWVSFAAVLLNGRMIADIGPMDEGYFLYFEDAEYCLRARRAGWRIRLVPEARASHAEGGSGDVIPAHRARARLPAYYYASRTRFLYQAHGRGGLLAANLLWTVGRWLTGIRILTGRAVYPSARGEHRDIWTNFRNPLGPRRAPGE